MPLDPLLVWLVVGLAAGWIASFFFSAGKTLLYIAAGVVGAIMTGYILAFFGVNIPVANWWIRQLFIASGGAVIVIFMVRIFA